MALFLALLTVGGSIGFAFVVFEIFEGPRIRKIWTDLESSNVEFIRDIMKLQAATRSLISDYDRELEVKYLVPQKRQRPWNILFGRVRLNLYVYSHRTPLTNSLVDIISRNAMTISKQKYFYMLLKEQVDTENREAAIKGLTYLKWYKDIP